MNQSLSSQELLRQIPAVDQILLQDSVAGWIRRTSHGFVVSAIQQVLQEIRTAIVSGIQSLDSSADLGRLINIDSVSAKLDERITMLLRPALQSLINATGVILHTNLGRAPLSPGAQESLSALSGQYTNLEYDLETGKRSHRDKLVANILEEVLGCESATVVNNNAAAVFLILNTLASGKAVIVSRGELVEIGGSFRVPDIMARSGAILREVGTTNKTRLQDYEKAITADTVLILRVHPSNYRIQGFTERPELKDLVALARRRNIIVAEDIGSGCLVDLAPFGIKEEPVVQQSLSDGADLVCFSGDKLLGGPQAGIIAGVRKYVEQIRKNPLMRTYRVEKLIYGALEATLASYRTGRALDEIPVLKLISMSGDEIARRAADFVQSLRPDLSVGVRIEVCRANSVVGGGSCPGSELSSAVIAIDSAEHRPHVLESRLRRQSPPVIIRLEGDRALIDLRTVFPAQEPLLREALVRALGNCDL